MTGKMLKGLYIAPDRNDFAVKEIPDELQSFYDLLKCETIDIVVLKVCGKDYDFVCDDDGLLKPEPRISATSSDTTRGACLVGRLFVCRHRGAQLVGLTDADIHILQSRLRVFEYNGFVNIGMEVD